MSSEAQNDVEAWKTAVTAATKSYESATQTFTTSVTGFDESLDRFSRNTPGVRATRLGTLLLGGVFGAEVVQGIGGADFPIFEFSDSVALTLLIIGVLFVFTGLAYDIYFNVKTVQSKERIVERQGQVASDNLKSRDRFIMHGLEIDNTSSSPPNLEDGSWRSTYGQ